MLPHQQRVVDEQQELRGKLGKLFEFFSTDTFKVLTKHEKDLLNAQAAAMSTYDSILLMRIEGFQTA